MQEIKDEALKRLGHSILGTFTLYMIVTNWKVMVILFSSLEPLYKIVEVGMLIESEALTNLVYSLLLTAFTVTVIPKLKTWYDKWILKQEYEIKAKAGEVRRTLEAEEYEVKNALSVVVEVRAVLLDKGRDLEQREISLRSLCERSLSDRSLSDEVRHSLRSLLTTSFEEVEKLKLLVEKYYATVEILERELRANDRIRK